MPVLGNSTTMQTPPWTSKNRGIVSPKNLYPARQQSPLIQPTDNSWPFFPNGAITIPAVGTSAIICAKTIPASKAGVITRVANSSNTGPGIDGWTPGDGSLVWQIVRNGQPFEYMDEIIVIVGLTENAGGELAAPLHVHPRDNIALIVKNVSLAARGQLLVGLLNGWLFPWKEFPANSR
jgi:hypothetical protein